ncbi:GNAT family N-acetyltransferase [Rhodobacterales bacterium 56_14_T64]|nr:GNAT family N-acetyltransferase [Rhodobacterales bacterium 56_14_T64]
MIIRAATAQDAEAICEIANWVIRDTLITFTTEEKTPEQLRAVIAEKGEDYLVAELDGQVVGHAYYGDFRAGPGYRYSVEHTVHLSPAVNGRGIGRALMSALEQRAVLGGKHVMVAGISSANPDGMDFHAAIGFVEVGCLPEVGYKNGQWLDTVLMQKILPRAGKPHPDNASKGG